MESLQDAQKLRTNLEQRQNMLEALEHTKIILGNEVEKLKLEKERLEKLCQDNKVSHTNKWNRDVYQTSKIGMFSKITVRS